MSGVYIRCVAVCECGKRKKYEVDLDDLSNLRRMDIDLPDGWENVDPTGWNSAVRCDRCTKRIAADRTKEAKRPRPVQHVDGCGTQVRGCMPGCENYDPKFDDPFWVDAERDQ